MGIHSRHGEIPQVRKHSEIARKYCHILKAYGPNSAEVKRAVLVIGTATVDIEAVRQLDTILQPAGGLSH